MKTMTRLFLIVSFLTVAACGGSQSKSEEPATETPATTEPAPTQGAACEAQGCGNTICGEAGAGIVSTCEWKAEYACYKTATCERQADGSCGWTQTGELTACLASPPAEAQ